jgi:hypothetical protein
MNLKKQNVDLEKTAAANVKKVAPAIDAKPAAEASSKPAKIDSPAAAAADAKEKSAKKPARKITEKDLEDLREKYDLGEGTFTEKSESDEITEEDAAPAEETDQEKDKTARTESDWKQEGATLRTQVTQAENAYNVLSKQCEQMKSWTVQSDTLYDSKGKMLNIVQEREKMCADAERARTILDQAKSAYNSFIAEARQEGVPPGWLRDPNE